MRVITINRRAARMLRENLTSNQEGYDYVDLLRLDRLAKDLTELQGEYADSMAEFARDERKLQRRLVRTTVQAEIDAITMALRNLAFDVDDLHEAAEREQVDFRVEDSDYKLILDKVNSVSKWSASDAIRHIVIGMVEAIRNAPAAEAANGHEPAELAKARRH